MIPAICLLFMSLLVEATSLQSADSATHKFEDDIRKFEEQDRVSGTRTGQILFLGSSSIRLWDLDTYFPGLEALNRGFGGSEISHSVLYFGTSRGRAGDSVQFFPAY